MARYVFALTAVLALLACSESGRPPAINTGSYDWTDAYWGPNGYRLPGWGPYEAK